MIHGLDGNDIIQGNQGDDMIISDAGNDNLVGNDGINTIDGGTGNDIISGGTQNDILFGGDDNDTIGGDAGADLIVGGAGNDVLFGQNAADTDEDNAVNTLYGDFGTNGDEPGSGGDQLFGQGGNDELFGEDGDDSISGGAGASNLIDYGSGEGANPDDFVTPPTAPPTAQSAAPGNLAAPSLPLGIDDRGRWTELVGSASPAGVSGDVGESIEPSLVADGTSRYMAWADNRNGNFEIYLTRHTAGAWTELAGSASNSGISNTLG